MFASFVYAEFSDIHRESFRVLDAYRSSVDAQAGESSEISIRDWLLSRHSVGLGDFVAGVHQEVGEFAVVRQQDESIRVDVEPSDGVDALGDGDEVSHGCPSVCVADGADDVAWLVEEDVDVFLGADGFAVDE